MADVSAQQFGILAGLQLHADGRVAGQQCLALLLEARQRHQHRAFRQRRVVRHGRKAVLRVSAAS